MKIISEHLVEVDYSTSNFPGNYITAYFIDSGRSGFAKINLAIVQFHVGAREWEVRYELEERGMRPAEFRELVAIKEFPQLKEKFIIFASGSIVKQGLYSRACACIKINKDNVQYDLARFGGDLGQPYFAAVYEGGN